MLTIDDTQQLHTETMHMVSVFTVFVIFSSTAA